MQIRKSLFAAAMAAGILATTAVPALAFDCNVANKPVGAGSVGTFNVVTGEVDLSCTSPAVHHVG